MFIILKKKPQQYIREQLGGAAHPHTLRAFILFFLITYNSECRRNTAAIRYTGTLLYIRNVCVCVCVVNFSLNTRLNVSHLLHFLAGRTMQRRGAELSWFRRNILCLAILFVKNHADIMNLKRHTGKLVSLFSIANDDDVQKREMFYCIYVPHTSIHII